jgi:ATP-dependent DNA helicase RecG
MISEKENILQQSVQFLKSVGPKRAESFYKIGIHTIKDILFYFPSRHLDRTNILTSAKVYNYVLNGYAGEVTIIAKVYEKERLRFRGREMMKVNFRDESGFFECVWFQGVRYFYDVFKEGEYFAISGKPSVSKYKDIQFTHPDFDKITEEESTMFLNTGKIIPFYRVPKELKSTNIGDTSLRRIISYAVNNFADQLTETLPGYIIEEQKLPSIIEAVKNFHYPESREKLEEAFHRFKFEELFYLEILVALRKKHTQISSSCIQYKINTPLVKKFIEWLPFKLTKAQLKVLSEIKKDMLSAKVMNRLLQGDVGSGKTIVAVIAMLIAADNSYQSVLMAPTEILADQHAKNISSMMKEFNKVYPEKEIKVSLILGGRKKSVREQAKLHKELEESDIIIGTHALFEEKIKFPSLGLVIVDEQHRFGVVQRAKLLSKGTSPDIMVMSATPIPRTLTMTLYGDLDNSVIDEMPANRKPIKTVLRGESRLPEIFSFIVSKVKERYQVFIVYPLVEESEKLDLKDAISHFEQLKSTYLKDLSVGLIHGRMSWQEKEEVMLHFLNKKFDVLISTTVIEVGIDIPDANIILINDAHRFGLSQLHQLRGRIGRGTMQGYCILVTKDEFVHRQQRIDIEYLSPTQMDKYKSSIRLQTMVKHLDGFKIAETDLKLRGPGDIFGIKQSGFPELKYADIITDGSLIYTAKEKAFKIIYDDPELRSPQNILIKKNLLQNYHQHLEYSRIG